MDASPTTRCARLRTFGLGLLAAAALTACTSPIDESDRDAFRAALGDTSITVYPSFVRTNADEGSHHDTASAERLAAWIAGHDLARVVVSSDEVALPQDVQGYQYDVFLTDAKAFGAWVASHPIGTAYALLSESLITRVPAGGTKAGGIHAYVVDARGELVDALVLNSHHDVFREADASTQPECTEVVIRVLADEWKVDG